jgi:hypothetical protein
LCVMQWLNAFLTACLRTLPWAQPQHVARILWGLASLRYRPTQRWLRHVYEQTIVQVGNVTSCKVIPSHHDVISLARGALVLLQGRCTAAAAAAAATMPAQ